MTFARGCFIAFPVGDRREDGKRGFTAAVKMAVDLRRGRGNDMV